jgi:hypothetical protein
MRQVKPLMVAHQMNLLNISTQEGQWLDKQNWGGSRLGMLKYNDIYKKVKEDWEADNGAYEDSECMILHCVEKTKNKRKLRSIGSLG